MKLIELKCKNCGAILKVNTELNEFFCNYCGNKVIIDDEATNIDRIENAKLKSRKLNHEQSMKEKTDNYEFEKKLKEEKIKQKIKMSIILGVIGIVLMFVGIGAIEFSGNDDNMFGLFALIGFFPLMGIAFLWINNDDKNK